MISLTMSRPGKFYQSPQFSELKAEWDDKLRQTGFVDIEDDYGMLKTPDKRTIGFQNRDLIRDFFTELGNYTETETNIPKRDRRVLSLYLKGVYQKAIAREISMSFATVKTIIQKYKKIIRERLTD